MKDKISKYGQFFTENDMCKSVLEIINKIKKIEGNILEPSFGSGNFIEALQKDSNTNIYGIEIDKDHFDKYENENKNLFNDDFLNFNNNIKYDFIIGNPPYIELCYSFYSKQEQERLKKEFKGISNGRINLVHLFIKKSFDIISDDGIIAYLLPSSILTSPTYKAIRKIIYEQYNIEFLIEDISFKDVAIQVSILVIRKTKNNGNYLFLNNDNYFIMENYKKFDSSKTIKDFGFDVSIGEVVWNQKKELLSSDKNDNMLVYSTNITENGIKIGVGSNDGKKQYIKNHSVKYKDCIIFPRTVSKKIKYILIKENKNMIFENHVLVLTHKDIEMLDKFYSNMKSGMYDELLLSFFNTSNLTKGELLSLPFDY